MSRLDPKNREQAFAYQFEDDVKMLHAVAMTGADNFNKALGTLEGHIAAYRNKNLIRQAKKAQAKNEERQKFMKQFRLKRKQHMV